MICAMRKKRNEVSYYYEIQRFIEAQIKSNFLAQRQRALYVFWGIGELKTNLQRIINLNMEQCGCAEHFMQQIPPLNLDIFALITDSVKFELLILEVKLMNSVGLKEWSQLVGYCLVSGPKYGLLINIDNSASSRLANILIAEEHISHIRTIVNNDSHEHRLGLMYWDSLTQSLEYSNIGFIKSLSALSNHLSSQF